jgi:aspartyl-tRNA(Asn)/glutamyl-tRNA(Gln) amidotransferase subunit C
LRRGTDRARARAKTPEGHGLPPCQDHAFGRMSRMAITREEVLHVAKLARLELSEEEIERLTGELSAILEAVSKVSELDLSDVPPTSHPLDVVNVWGADEPRPSLPVEDALANAPEREEAYFKVPPGGS